MKYQSNHLIALIIELLGTNVIRIDWIDAFHEYIYPLFLKKMYKIVLPSIDHGVKIVSYH